VDDLGVLPGRKEGRKEGRKKAMKTM